MIERIELPAGGECCEKRAKDNSFGIKSKPHMYHAVSEERTSSPIIFGDCNKKLELREHVDIKIFLSFTIIRSVTTCSAGRTKPSFGGHGRMEPTKRHAKRTKKMSPSLPRPSRAVTSILTRKTRKKAKSKQFE